LEEGVTSFVEEFAINYIGDELWKLTPKCVQITKGILKAGYNILKNKELATGMKNGKLVRNTFIAAKNELISAIDNFYSIFFKDNYSENLKNSYVPGNDYPDNLKLNSLVQIEEHLMNLPDDTGCYVCSCGFYYSIDPCGFPTEGQEFICPECQQAIGYGKKVIDVGAPNHGMVIRPGHYRIFRDLKQKEEQMSKFEDCDESNYIFKLIQKCSIYKRIY
jgi:hypothetical protein